MNILHKEILFEACLKLRCFKCINEQNKEAKELYYNALEFLESNDLLDEYFSLTLNSSGVK